MMIFRVRSVWSVWSVWCGSVQSDYIENLSPSLWLLAWLGSALAEVCQLTSSTYKKRKCTVQNENETPPISEVNS